MSNKKRVLQRKNRPTDLWQRMKFRVLGDTVLAIAGLTGLDGSSNVGDDGGIVGTGIIL